MTQDQRLIEDYLPIEAISAEAKREKSIRKGTSPPCTRGGHGIPAPPQAGALRLKMRLCPGRIFPSVTRLGDMMVSQPRGTGNRDASHPIRVERPPARSTMGQPSALVGKGFFAQYPGEVAHG
jgi:hypothetical protein